MSRERVENVKPHILRECREQIGLSIAEAEKKVGLKTLAKMEKGEIAPTYTQLDNLADRYYVPPWVFVSDELPGDYRFNQSIPAFRKFSKAGSESDFHDYNVRVVTANVCRLRELILDFRNDMDDGIPYFDCPVPGRGAGISQTAQSVREWLGRPDGSCKFSVWKQMIENKGIFVFMTSKYKGWSKIDLKSFRGLSIYYDTLPIIVINDSDSMKAQSFTLFHELGHLLKKQSALDSYGDNENHDEETWCNRFAGEILMPSDIFKEEIESFSQEESMEDIFDQIKLMADEFEVSSYAFIVRMRQLRVIQKNKYNDLVEHLEKKYQESREAQRAKGGGGERNIAREVLRQYGGIYSTTVMQTYLDGEIGLHKFCGLFGIKRISSALELRQKLLS